MANLPTYAKDTGHALEMFNTFEFENANPDELFLFTVDVISLCTIIPNDCGLPFIDIGSLFYQAPGTRASNLTLTLAYEQAS